MDLILSPAALDDLGEIQAYIARDNPRAAAAEIARINGVIQRLVTGELQGPEVRLRSGQRAQRWPVLPYLIYYRRPRNRTTILRVYHGARRPIE
jgi:plasmid stabilization system protein ParE